MALSSEFEQQYRTEIGTRLRDVRQRKRLSLADVAQASGGEFKAAIIGAYERGTRAISVARLRLLAQLYEVPMEELLPWEHCGSLYHDRGQTNEGSPPASFRINLTALRQAQSAEAVAVRNFIERVRTERHDYDGRVFTIRIEDLRVLGAAFGYDDRGMLDRLDDLKLLLRSQYP